MTLERAITIVRTIDAPREAVFRAWTEPDRLGWFFNPGFEVDAGDVEVDLRIGGAWRQRMRIDGDEEYVTGGFYRAIAAPERLVFAWGAVGGWPELSGPDDPEAPVASVLLNDLGGRTEMVFRLDLPDHLDAAAVREWFARGIRRGWTETLERLVARSASERSDAGMGFGGASGGTGAPAA